MSVDVVSDQVSVTNARDQANVSVAGERVKLIVSKSVAVNVVLEQAYVLNVEALASAYVAKVQEKETEDGVLICLASSVIGRYRKASPHVHGLDSPHR